jgi:death-on-curing protein
MEYKWVLKSVTFAVHQRQLAEHGGDDGVRDEGLLESALARPQNLLAYGDPEPDIAALAASYAYGILKNHPFLDGNKRVGYVVARTFLIMNGCDIKTTNEDKVLTMLAVASSRLGEEELANWFRQKLVKK